MTGFEGTVICEKCGNEFQWFCMKSGGNYWGRLYRNNLKNVKQCNRIRDTSRYAIHTVCPNKKRMSIKSLNIQVIK